MKTAERIDIFINKLGLSRVDFCKSVSYSYTSLSSALQRQSDIGEDLLVKIKNKYKTLSLNWLILGEGEMIESNKPTSVVLNAQNTQTGAADMMIMEAGVSYTNTPLDNCQEKVKLLEALVKEKERTIQILLERQPHNP